MRNRLVAAHGQKQCPGFDVVVEQCRDRRAAITAVVLDSDWDDGVLAVDLQLDQTGLVKLQHAWASWASSARSSGSAQTAFSTDTAASAKMIAKFFGLLSPGHSAAASPP